MEVTEEVRAVLRWPCAWRRSAVSTILLLSRITTHLRVGFGVAVGIVVFGVLSGSNKLKNSVIKYAAGMRRRDVVTLLLLVRRQALSKVHGPTAKLVNFGK